GGLGAVGTYNAKRMLAYSTLAQVGFILVGIGWGTPLSLAAALIYTFNHSLIKTAMLMLAGAMSSRAPVKSAAFATLIGVGRSYPAAGGLFFLGGIALAGIPPTNGFISKLVLFESGIDAQAFYSLAWVGVASLLTLVYTMRAFMKIWWQEPASPKYDKKSGDKLIVPAVLIALCLVLGLWASPLVDISQSIATWLGDPANYIMAVFGG
ncbi:MAG: proton-conducting transporter transmembrane domain-containing protein, partial [Anaerolineales bacterium]